MIATMKAKDAARSIVGEAGGRLLALSHGVHANPETAYEEYLSARMVADLLDADGRFTIEYGVAGLDTAFTATAGSGPLHLGICEPGRPCTRTWSSS